MTMVYTPDGLVYTAVPLPELVATNKTDAKVDVCVWEFGRVSEDAARKRAPEAQCEAQRNYNVAFELQQEAL